MKNKLSILWIFSAVMIIGVLFAGCENPAGGDDDLPISTIEYTLGSDGFYRYYTNDPSYYNYGFWDFLVQNPNDEAPSVYEIECKKISGANNYAYGMIFGASDEVSNLFYCVNIDTNGYYTIWKRVSNGEGGYKWDSDPIQNWTYTTSLNTGYNVLNTIKVEKLYSIYVIYFNGDFVDSFPYDNVEDEADGFGSRIGFYTSIGLEADEDFPNKPVDVRFRAK